MKNSHQRLGLDQPATYRIKVQGRLGERWSDWFGGMAIAVENDDNGTAVTTLTGTVTDQVALYGLLSRIRDLGLPLLLVECVDRGERSQSTRGGAENA
jgi:hypothetical protein